MARRSSLSTFLLPVPLLFLACSDGDANAGGANGSPTCAELDQLECADRSGDSAEESTACHPITARPSCDDGPWEFIVCADGGDGDGTAETCAWNPETDAPYTFPTTEIPPDWTAIPCDQAAASCELGGAGGMND